MPQSNDDHYISFLKDSKYFLNFSHRQQRLLGLNLFGLRVKLIILLSNMPTKNNHPVQILVVWKMNKACKQFSHNAIFHWDFWKYSVKMLYAIID